MWMAIANRIQAFCGHIKSQGEAIGYSTFPIVEPGSGHHAIGAEHQPTIIWDGKKTGIIIGNWFRPVTVQMPEGADQRNVISCATVYITGPHPLPKAINAYGLWSEYTAGPSRFDDAVVVGGPEIVRKFNVVGDGAALIGRLGQEAITIDFCHGQQGTPAAAIKCEKRDDEAGPAGDLVFQTRTNEGGGATREVMRITSEGKVLIMGREVMTR